MSGKHEEFILLFSKHQRQIHAHISMLLPHPADVDEVLQETSLILWSKFDQYRRDESFLGWGCGIAHLEVMRFYRRNRRRLLPIDDGLIEQLASERRSMQTSLLDRQAHLADCMRELKDNDRRLIDLCYRPEGSFKEAAEELQRPANAVYKSLGRIRRRLLECMTRKAAAEQRK